MVYHSLGFMSCSNFFTSHTNSLEVQSYCWDHVISYGLKEIEHLTVWWLSDQKTSSIKAALNNYKQQWGITKSRTRRHENIKNYLSFLKWFQRYFIAIFLYLTIYSCFYPTVNKLLESTSFSLWGYWRHWLIQSTIQIKRVAKQRINRDFWVTVHLPLP